MKKWELEEHLRKAILLLDCAMPHFDREVRAEERRNIDAYGLKEVTNKQRREAVVEMIREVGPLVGYSEA